MSKENDEAYRAAQAEIARVKASGGTLLELSNTAWLRGKARNLLTIPPEIAELTAIDTLFLTGTQITDLTPIAGLTAIRELDLIDTPVSDLTPIAGLTAITGLYISGTQVRDLTPLAGLTSIRRLWLKRTEVSDLTPIRRLTAIERLELDDTQVSDLTPIAGMRRLAAAVYAFDGLSFARIPATEADPRIKEIAAIVDNRTRASALFAYLEVQEPSPTGLPYQVAQDGRVAYGPPAVLPDLGPRAAQIHALLVEDLPDLILRFSGHNQPWATVAKSLNRYSSGLGERAEAVLPALVWKAGNDLRVYLRREADRTPQDMSNTPLLDADLRGELEGFVATHNVLATLHPDLAALDAASIDPADRQRAEMDRALLQAAIEAFAAQTRLIMADIISDLRDLHTEALGTGKPAERALVIEQESLENLLKEIVAQAVVEVQRDETFAEKIAGDLRATAVGTVAAGLATNFPQLVAAVSPEMGAVISTLHGHEYSLLQAMAWVRDRLAARMSKG